MPVATEKNLHCLISNNSDRIISNLISRLLRFRYTSHNMTKKEQSEKDCTEIPERNVKDRPRSTNTTEKQQAVDITACGPSNSNNAFPGYSFRMNEDGTGGSIVLEQGSNGGQLLQMPHGTWIISSNNDIVAAPFPLSKPNINNHIYQVMHEIDRGTETEDWTDSSQTMDFFENIPNSSEEFQPDFNSTLEMEMSSTEDDDDDSESEILAGSSFFSQSTVFK